MAETVCDKFDKAVRLVESIENSGHDLNIFVLVSSADVVSFARNTLFISEPNRRAMVVNKYPVAHIAPVAVNGQRLVVYRVGDH